MKIALQDFTHAGVSVKAGDEIPFGMFEADELYRLILDGLVKDDRPAAEPKKVQVSKKPASKSK